MNPLAVLLLLLIVCPALDRTAYAESQAAGGPPPGSFDRALAGEVVGSGLAFLAPRTLENVPLPQLASWGLRGLAAIDPSLTVLASGPDLRVTTGERVLITRTAPPADNPEAWGEAAAELADAAWSASPALRRAGTEGVIRAFFDELFNHLDPYSRYVPPREAREDRDRRSGAAGIGLRVVGRRGAIAAGEVTAEGPADNAGIRPGERILSVDGQSTAQADAPTVASWIAGPEDSTLAIVVRGRDGRSRSLDLVRALVPPETVFPERRGPLLIVHITGFSRTTGQRLAHVLTEGLGESNGKPSPVQGLVIDLRGNRGGLLGQAVSATDMLLPAGIVAVTAGRNPESSRLWESSGGDLAPGLPVVVLVDGRSASAAEVMAAALADRGRAVVVGSTTLGKGLVQTIAPMPDGGELFVTWSRILAPRGWPLQGLGVVPQVCTSLGPEEVQRELARLAQGVPPMPQAIARERDARAPVSNAEALEIRNACPPAEGREGDMDVAKFLISNPVAYAAALLPAMAGGPP